jgi:hypothetical protein
VVQAAPLPAPAAPQTAAPPAATPPADSSPAAAEKPPVANSAAADVPPVAPDINTWVKIAPNANRYGAAIQQPVLDFVSQIGQVYGKPLVIGTGTNHNQYVSNTHRESAHWTGWAVDIPASGKTLTDYGHAALIAAGVPPAQALKMNGGLYNVNGYQIIFNIDLKEGGNHWNHLHLGLAPSRQTV